MCYADYLVHHGTHLAIFNFCLSPSFCHPVTLPPSDTSTLDLSLGNLSLGDHDLLSPHSK